MFFTDQINAVLVSTFYKNIKKIFATPNLCTVVYMQLVAASNLSFEHVVCSFFCLNPSKCIYWEETTGLVLVKWFIGTLGCL